MTVKINGTQDSALGFLVDLEEGWRSGDLRFVTAEVPRRPGLVVMDATPAEKARPIVLTGVLRGTSTSDALAKYRTLLAVAKPYMLSTLVFDDDTTKERRAYLTGWAKAKQAAVMASSLYTVSLTFDPIDQPYWYDVSDQTVSGIVNSDTAIPLGNAPSRPVLTITGATNPTVTYKDSSAVSQQTMTFTGVGSGDTVVIDLAALTVKLNGAANLSILTGGQITWTLDPISHGVYATSSWPTLRVSSGSMSCVYRRAWRG
jgi:phage-related protein